MSRVQVEVGSSKPRCRHPRLGGDPVTLLLHLEMRKLLAVPQSEKQSRWVPAYAGTTSHHHRFKS